jgi:hypothetical protein
MPLYDYNGTGEWSADAILARYREYAKQFAVVSEADLRPMTYSKGDARWVYPVMHKVIEGIEAGDPACAEVGIDFISQDSSFPFGMTLKTYTARALRRAPLNDKQQVRIRRRVLDMLMRGYVPKEYREYAKLLRKIGIANERDALARANKRNPHVAKYVKYFEAAFRNDAV